MRPLRDKKRRQYLKIMCQICIFISFDEYKVYLLNLNIEKQTNDSDIVMYRICNFKIRYNISKI